MKSRTVYEHEYMRHNVTPAQFLAYLRTMQKKHPGELCNDFDLNMFAAKGWSASYTNALPSEKPCHAERVTDNEYEKQTYICAFDGTVYNEIIEFQFDDDKTGTGYYYTIQTEVDEANAAENTAEIITATIRRRAEKAEKQEARAAKIEAEADKAETEGYTAKWWIEGRRAEAASLRREAADTRAAIAATEAENAPETAEQEQTEEQTAEAAEDATAPTKKPTHAAPAKLAKHYTVYTHTNRTAYQRPRLNDYGNRSNSAGWRYYHRPTDDATQGAGTPRTSNAR